MNELVIRDILAVLKVAYHAVKRKNYHALEGLSNRLNHSITTYQLRELSDCAVTVFALSKIFDKDIINSEFDDFRQKVISFIKSAAYFLKRKMFESYSEEMFKLKEEIKRYDDKLQIYQEPVIIYSRGIKATHAVEHGLSIEKASKLFDIAEWDIHANIGKSKSMEVSYAPPLNNLNRMELAKKLFKVKV